MGEQQRVAFARVLLLAPRYVILDEATSALDATNEEHPYRLLAASGIAFFSVAHRASLRPYHRQVLEFCEAGRWVLHGARDGKSVHSLA